MIRKIGKIGKINRIARQKIAEIAEREGLDRCALKLAPDCWGEAHGPAHRHPRVWYRSCPEKLWDKKQWIEACNVCHQVLDYELSAGQAELIFMSIRGPE